MDSVKEAIKGYSIVGTVMACFMLTIRPFVSIRQTIRDTAIVFLFTVLSGIILENFVISEYLKLGLSGCIGFWAVEIYKIIKSVCDHVESHPEIVDKIISKKHDED